MQSQTSKLHPVQDTGQIKCQASHLPRTNETVLFLPAVLHKSYNSEDDPIRDKSCQLSLVLWLASGTDSALDWPQPLVPADAACEEMGDGKGLVIVPTPHIEPPTLTSTTVREIRKPGSGTAQTLRHAASMSDTYAKCRRGKGLHIVCSVKSWLHSGKPDPSSGGCACSDHASGL